MLQSGMDTAPDFLFTRSSKTGGAPRCAYPSKTRIVSENNCCRLRSKTALTSIDPFPSWFIAISRQHRGVFTPPNSNFHMHVRTLDNRLAGHLEYVRSKQLVTVCVPGVGNTF